MYSGTISSYGTAARYAATTPTSPPTSRFGQRRGRWRRSRSDRPLACRKQTEPRGIDRWQPAEIERDASLGCQKGTPRSMSRAPQRDKSSPALLDEARAQRRSPDIALATSLPRTTRVQIRARGAQQERDPAEPAHVTMPLGTSGAATTSGMTTATARAGNAGARVLRLATSRPLVARVRATAFAVAPVRGGCSSSWIWGEIEMG